MASLREKAGLERPYILAVGTIEPRKNLKFLVDVFEHLAADSATEGLDLVIAGAPGWRCDDILARFETSPRASRIHYMRYVPDGQLAALYTGAAVLAVPSHYEGFGFPPLEAMACGTPVVSSAGGSLPEVLGDAALVVPDFAPDAWRAALGRAAGDAGLRAKLRPAGMARAATFRWEKTAAETWRVYRGEAEARA